MTVRVATFNVENLMSRFDFSGWKNDRRRDRSISLLEVSSKKMFETLEQARVVTHADDTRQMTALAIADCTADIVCLQEVENLETLEAFENNYLYRMTGLSYPQKVWVEGNDGRGIDVALMAREKNSEGEEIEILNVTSHRKKTYSEMGVHNSRLQELGADSDERVFRRDCLEVDLRVGRKRLSLFVCHFKSMGPRRRGVDGRDYTMPVRMAEAQTVRKIIEAKFGVERAPKMRWMVCGDLNDYMARRAEDDRWTLYHSAGPVLDMKFPEARDTRHLVQLDYLLASPALARANKNAVPDVVRNGQPFRTVFPAGQNVERYPRTGWDRPKASDHCPVAVTLQMV